MLLGQIQAFVEVVRRGTVLRASEALYISQPALTARLRGLERELGGRLFARSGRGLRLTRAGRAFLPYAERTLHSVADGRHAVDDLAAGRGGRLVVGATGAVIGYVLPAVIRRFREERPRVELKVKFGPAAQVLDLVLSESVELGIGRERQHPDLETIPLYEDEVVLVTHPAHDFVSRRCVSLEEVASEGLISFAQSSGYYADAQALFASHKISPKIVMELESFEAVKRMVEAALGVALMPRVAVRRELRLNQLAEVPIADTPPLLYRTVLMRRADVGSMDGVTGAFVALLREMTAAPGVWENLS